MSGMSKKALFLAVLLASAGLGVSAAGQEPTSALKGHNTNAPVDWEAERVEVNDKANRVLLTGNVVARQAELTLRAARVTAAYTSGNGVHVDRLDASGGVLITSPSETARGEYGIYDLNAKLITLIGGVVLTRGQSNVRGGRLVLDLDSGRAVMDGAAGGGGRPGASTPETGGRVTGRFIVPQKQQ
jgi:lipopolysaccharide export system protein LptA